MSSFDLKLIRIKLRFQSGRGILLSKVRYVWSKSNHADELKTIARGNEKRRHMRKHC